MRVAIVGHGPSLLKASLGWDINHHETIVRVKRSWQLTEQYPEQYGRGATIAIGSFIIAPGLMEGWRARGVEQFWLFEDTRTEGHDFPIPEGAICDRELCREWRNVYREIRRPVKLSDAQRTFDGLSDAKGHLHPSAGMHAILYAMKLLGPDELNLYGFDSLTSGRFTWSVTRGPEHMGYPDHNWSAERELLVLAAERYGYHITPVVLNGSLMRLDRDS